MRLVYSQNKVRSNFHIPIQLKDAKKQLISIGATPVFTPKSAGSSSKIKAKDGNAPNVKVYHPMPLIDVSY